LVFKDPSSLEAQYEVLVHQDTPDPSWNFDLTLWAMPSNPENLLLTVPTQLEMDRSNESVTETQIGKGNFLMKRAWTATISVTRRFIVILFLTLISILQLVTQGIKIMVGWVRTEDGGKKNLDNRVEEFREQVVSPIHLPSVLSPSGHIANSFIREDRSPIVPSTISCTFTDRTDLEIIDRIRSEVPYHQRNGFNNQAIVGAHTATELRPTYEDGRLA
jgi:hypothetical protein